MHKASAEDSVFLQIKRRILPLLSYNKKQHYE